MRIATWNIQAAHGAPGRDHSAPTRANVAAIAEILSAITPDVIALQEVDYRQRRSGQVDQSDAIAADLSCLSGRRYRAYFAAHTRNNYLRFRPRHSRRATYPATGVAIITHLPLGAWRVYQPRWALPSVQLRAIKAPLYQRLRIYDTTRSYPVATIIDGDQRWNIGCVHLPVGEQIGQWQLREFAAALSALAGVNLAVGDMNLTPPKVLAALDDTWRAIVPQTPTFPNPHPRRAIDGYYSPSRLRVTDFAVRTERISDHALMWADVERCE